MAAKRRGGRGRRRTVATKRKGAKPVTMSSAARSAAKKVSERIDPPAASPAAVFYEVPETETFPPSVALEAPPEAGEEIVEPPEPVFEEAVEEPVAPAVVEPVPAPNLQLVEPTVEPASETSP